MQSDKQNDKSIEGNKENVRRADHEESLKDESGSGDKGVTS